MTNEDWLIHATVFTFGGKPPNMRRYVQDYPVTIEARDQRDGSVLWVVKQTGNCLRKDGDWELEMQPSSRTDEWIAMTRWATKEDAYAALVPALLVLAGEERVTRD